MQKKAVAWSGEIPCEKMDIPHPLVSAVNLVYLLTSSLDCAPVIYSSADNELWAYYPNSCFVCEEFLESYGWFMAAAGITVYGGADGFESGQLIAELNTNGDSLHCTKLNVSGTDYETIRDIALKIPVHDLSALPEYQRLLSAISPKCSYIAAERTELIENVFRDIPQQSEDAYFRYIVLTGYDCCLNTLSIQQRKKLWLMYFGDGLSPLEFEDAFSAIERGEISAFPWELALRLALEEAGITVSYENGYCVNDRSGKRISPDFSSELAAERLFAKLIFPKKPFKASARKNQYRIKEQKMKSVLLIGLGRFGLNIAKKLKEMKNDVLAVDCNEERVTEAMHFVTKALIGDSTKKDFLLSLGVRNFDVCIVTIGENFQNSLETTALLQELGAHKVVSRASSDFQVKFLLKNGADEVVYPEEQLASWTAIRYTSDNVFDYIELDGDYARAFRAEKLGGENRRRNQYPQKIRNKYTCGTKKRKALPRYFNGNPSWRKGYSAGFWKQRFRKEMLSYIIRSPIKTIR